MKIDDDHLYHGAALIQIAEHPQFTAINSLKIKNTVVRSAYRINDHIAVYLKYAEKATGIFKEYRFTFSAEHLDTIKTIRAACTRTFIALVCVKGREICAINVDELNKLIELRKAALGSEEDAYTVIVTIPIGKSMRFYMNQPGKKKTILSKPVVISRNAFPSSLFQN